VIDFLNKIDFRISLLPKNENIIKLIYVISVKVKTFNNKNWSLKIVFKHIICLKLRMYLQNMRRKQLIYAIYKKPIKNK